jgi:alginate O-acetyltransferase complex protein AlgI
VSAAVVLLGRLTAWDAAPLVTPLLIAVVAGSIASQFVPLRLRDGLLATFSRLEPMAQATALALGLVLINVLGPEGVAPFIYFQF